MEAYWEMKNEELKDIYSKLIALRNESILNGDPNSGLLTALSLEFSYRVAIEPVVLESRSLESGSDGIELRCPRCLEKMPESPTDHYCASCGQFIKRQEMC